tara:strand:+ start:189 stop:641 length:453 start_codon:yes stop_codon:yes gene_type:complete
MKRIIYTNQDLTTSIVVPTDDTVDFEALANMVVPEGLSYEIVDITEIPSDRTYRNVWRHDTTPSLQKIGVVLADAQSISLEKVRAKRDTALLEVDKQYIIASRTRESTVALDAERLSLLAATDPLKGLDVSSNKIIPVEEAAALIAPLEA